MKNGSLRKLHLMTKPCNFASQKVGVVFQTTQKTPQLYIPLSDGIESSNEKGICSWSVCTSTGTILLRLGGTSSTEGNKAHTDFSFHKKKYN